MRQLATRCQLLCQVGGRKDGTTTTCHVDDGFGGCGSHRPLQEPTARLSLKNP